MKQLLLSAMVIHITLLSFAQNVGIGTTSPIEKLDVNGNVNISGTIKANGTAGQNGQVLVSTGTGLSWGSLAGYRKAQSFANSGAATFTVPGGVTEVMVEAWGAGSGGSLNCGGNSGGYGRTVRTVAPGDVINISVGAGSFHGTTTSNGGNTTVTFGANVLTAFGGGGIQSANQLGYVYSGSTSGVFDNSYFLYGATGSPNLTTGFLRNATTYVEMVEYGAGGPPVGFINPPVQHGDVFRFENGTYISYIAAPGQSSVFPSAGGSAGNFTFQGGWSGANGFVVIWWN